MPTKISNYDLALLFLFTIPIYSILLSYCLYCLSLPNNLPLNFVLLLSRLTYRSTNNILTVEQHIHKSTQKVLFRTTIHPKSPFQDSSIFFCLKKTKYTKKKKKKTKKKIKKQQKSVHPKKFFSELQSNPTVLFRTHLFLSV